MTSFHSPAPTLPGGKAVLFVLITGLCGLLLFACASPEQKRQQRQKSLEKLAGSVAKHLFDRNPDTVRESINILHRQELSEAAFEKLQAAGHLPKTELGILKIITEAEDLQQTNNVQVASVKVTGDVEKLQVPLLVDGQISTKTQGKADVIKPFHLTVTCTWDQKTSDYPQVTDVTVGSIAKPAAVAKDFPKKKKRRR